MKWFIVVVASLWVAGAMAESPDGGRLTVVGEGFADAVPDMATITLGVMSEAKTAGVALRETSAATAEVLALLTDKGIAPRDMQTSNLSLSPLWNNSSSLNGERGISGYQANNTVVVRVRALDGLGEILDAVVDQGANTFNGLSFGLQNPGPAQDAARKAAVAEAMRKAALYTEAAGLVLGPVLELSESGAATPQPMAMERMVMAVKAVPIAQGEVSVEACVTMVFSLMEK